MDPDASHVLLNRSTGMAMDINAASVENGAAVVQWNRNDRPNQQFVFVDSGNGYYRIIARHSGLALDVFDFNLDEGADIVQWENLNGTNQQFRIDDMGNGYARFVNNLSGKALAPLAGSSEAGARISQYEPSNDQSQQWQVVEVEAIAPDPIAGECGMGNPEAIVTGGPGTYQVNGANVGGSYLEAINNALGRLTSGRNSQERVVVMADGSIGANRINLPSNTIFEVCGTMDVGNARGTGAIRAIGVRNVSIPFLKMTGSPWFGMHFADVHGLHLGQIDLRLSGGLGIRFERDLPGSTNVRMDHVYVSGTNNHGVETWNIDGLEIGTVIARDTAYAGLLLNNTRNANIGLVDGQGTGNGTGYATLRFANRNGRVGNSYPTNIFIDRVISRGGGRGLFCVSESGGAEINRIDFADNGNNAILVENCYNVTIHGGVIDGGGEVRIAARSDFPNTRDVTIANLEVSGTSVRESPCGDNVEWVNLVVQGGSTDICD